MRGFVILKFKKEEMKTFRQRIEKAWKNINEIKPK